MASFLRWFMILGVFVALALAVEPASRSAAGGTGRSASAGRRGPPDSPEDIVARLLAGRSGVNAPDDRGLTALHRAVHLGSTAAVELLIEMGADVNARGACGRTPLHDAALLGESGPAAALVAHGARVGTADRAGRTPLHEAARLGGPRLATLLIAHGAETDAMDASGATPLAQALRWGRKTVAQVLRRADPHGRQAPVR